MMKSYGPLLYICVCLEREIRTIFICFQTVQNDMLTVYVYMDMSSHSRDTDMSFPTDYSVSEH